jgi:dephospho-CoA kinase
LQIIGITGGIGSGKSVVCELFRIYGYPVYDADKRAKELNEHSQVIREKLTKHFGMDLYEGNKLNKKKLADLMFSSEKDLKIANSIIHPEIAKDFLSWAAKRKELDVVVIDAAVLFEAKFNKIVDKVVTVYAPYELRLKRASERDHTDKSSIARRANSQLPEEEKIKMADFVIYNDNVHSLIAQVSELLDSLKIQSTH